MLERGELVPHFNVTTITGGSFSYSTIWQHKNLALIALPADSTGPTIEAYAAELQTRRGDFDQLHAEYVITRDAVAGMPVPGVLVADRWGEIVHVASCDVDDLPPVHDLLDWIDYAQRQCPECQGEVR